MQSAGKYTLSTRVDRVSDIVRRSGGLISDAYSEGAFIKRSRYNIDSLKSDESKTSILDMIFFAASPITICSGNEY